MNSVDLADIPEMIERPFWCRLSSNSEAKLENEEGRVPAGPRKRKTFHCVNSACHNMPNNGFNTLNLAQKCLRLNVVVPLTISPNVTRGQWDYCAGIVIFPLQGEIWGIYRGKKRDDGYCDVFKHRHTASSQNRARHGTASDSTTFQPIGGILQSAPAYCRGRLECLPMCRLVNARTCKADAGRQIDQCSMQATLTCLK